MLAHSLPWILTVAGDSWLGQCLSEEGEEIKSVLDECSIAKGLIRMEMQVLHFPAGQAQRRQENSCLHHNIWPKYLPLQQKRAEAL